MVWITLLQHSTPNNFVQVGEGNYLFPLLLFPRLRMCLARVFRARRFLFPPGLLHVFLSRDSRPGV